MAEPRTEVEVAADTIITLLLEGMLNRRHLLGAAAAAGLTYPDIDDAMKRRHAKGFVAPRGAPEPDPEPETQSNRYGKPKPCPKGCGRWFVHFGRHVSVCTGEAA